MFHKVRVDSASRFWKCKPSSLKRDSTQNYGRVQGRIPTHLDQASGNAGMASRIGLGIQATVSKELVHLTSWASMAS